MDRNDLAALLVDASADEVDRIHRLLHEWNTGPDNSFPVQLTLLTKAQWRIAATLPRLMDESRKLLEIHLAEYRRQTKSQFDELAILVQKEHAVLKAAGEDNAWNTVLASEKIKVQLDDVQTIAKNVKAQIENAASEWLTVKHQMSIQCEKLKEVSNDLQDRFAWRTLILWTMWFAIAFGIGLAIGLCWIHPSLGHK